METKIYVGNLAYSTTEEALRTLFSKFGGVVSVEVIKDRDTGSSKGFAFVEMSSQSEASKAISSLNETTLEDRAIKVNFAKPREERPRSNSYSDSSYRGYGNKSSGGKNRGGNTRRY
jgi:RNA recognition motif-containing protein